jgi:metal-responsive CopG/Arc/MetJ family transcriptional regulator
MMYIASKCITMKLKRIVISLPEETLDKIKEFAAKDSRSISSTTMLLLKFAVKEKLRKRKSDNEEDNS